MEEGLQHIVVRVVGIGTLKERLILEIVKLAKSHVNYNIDDRAYNT